MSTKQPMMMPGVIRDLYPLYLAGEASPDTQLLMDNYLRDHPELVQELEAANAWALTKELPGLPVDLDKSALKRTKHLLQLRSVLLGISIFVTLLPFSYGDTGDGAHWLFWPSQKGLVVILLVIAGFGWSAYLATHRRLQVRGF